jgi:hypothetical protein
MTDIDTAPVNDLPDALTWTRDGDNLSRAKGYSARRI